MSSPWKTKQPEAVADAILKRAQVGKISRKLKTRLAFAQYKAARGWQDLSLDMIEPKVEEELRQKRPMSSGDIMSDSSSSSSSDTTPYPRSSRHLMSSPLKDSVTFSDQVHSRSGSGSSSSFRKRNYGKSFEDAALSTGNRKRFQSSPPAGRANSGNGSWKFHQTQSSPIKPRKQAHFTTASGPSLSFFSGTAQNSIDRQSSNYAAGSDDEEDTLPVHSFNITSSPPRTPPPARNRGSLGRRTAKNGKSGEEGADLLLYLATSPSPANTNRTRMQPPSTPPPKTSLALPSAMISTPGSAGNSLLAMFGGAPTTPGTAFEFSDFINVTPSPAQGNWPKTPRTIKTPGTVGRRRLDFGLFPSPNPGDANTREKHGLGLGGDLLS